MADIDIVPKTRSRAWLWALLLVALLVIVWMIVSGGSAPRNGLRESVPAGPAAQLQTRPLPLGSA